MLRMRAPSLRLIGWVLLMLLWHGSASSLRAQEDRVGLSVGPEQVGLGGLVRPGGWTPMQLTLENRVAAPLKVRCEWILADADGDEVHARRRVTLSPQRTQQVWLYAVPPIALKPNTPWRVLVIDDATGELLASQSVVPAQILSPYDRVVGSTSNLNLALQPYEKPWTQHESMRVLRGLEPGTLPDRWYGLSLLQALIWTPDATGADPGSPDISAETRQALLEWLRRGGHLVIVLPAVGDLWSDSPFKELLGDLKMATLTNVPPPLFLGTASRNPVNIDEKVLDPGPDMTVLLRDEKNRPLAVARQYGLGRVTILGLDLTDRRLTQMDLPDSYTLGYPRPGERLWPTIFGWRGSVPRQSYIDSELQAGRFVDPGTRTSVELDRFLIGEAIDMRAILSAPLLLAIIFFGLYWLAAGPVSFGMLKKRGLVRHSWTVFGVIVLISASVAWGGALLLRPTRQSIEHFTVIDADGATGLVHAHSWLSLYSPAHGKMMLAVDPAQSSDNHNTLASPGLSPEQSDSGFLNPQRYDVDAAAPGSVAMPFRATAKQMEIDYLGRWVSGQDLLPQPWVMPQGRIRRDKDGWPRGKISHGLPGPLKDVIVIYDRGDGSGPYVWPWQSQWAPGQAIDIAPPGQGLTPMLTPPAGGSIEWGGYIAALLRGRPGHNIAKVDLTQVRISPDQRVKFMELFTFYSALPPPRFTKEANVFLAGDDVPICYLRSVGRSLDLWPLIPLGRVIVIGHLQQAPLPVPLQVDEAAVPAKGWTTVRWIGPVED